MGRWGPVFQNKARRRRDAKPHLGPLLGLNPPGVLVEPLKARLVPEKGLFLVLAPPVPVFPPAAAPSTAETLGGPAAHVHVLEAPLAAAPGLPTAKRQEK